MSEERVSVWADRQRRRRRRWWGRWSMGTRETSRRETPDNRDSQVARTGGIDLCNVAVAQSLFAIGYCPPFVRRCCYCWATHDDAQTRISPISRARLLARAWSRPGKENIVGRMKGKKIFFSLSLPGPRLVGALILRCECNGHGLKTARAGERGFDILLAGPDKHETRRYRNARVERG